MTNPRNLSIIKDMKKWYTVQELADFLGLSRATVYLAIKEGRLKTDMEFDHFKVFGPTTIKKLMKRKEELKAGGFEIAYHLFRRKK